MSDSDHGTASVHDGGHNRVRKPADHESPNILLWMDVRHGNTTLWKLSRTTYRASNLLDEELPITSSLALIPRNSSLKLRVGRLFKR